MKNLFVQNMGTRDRTLRVGIGVILLILGVFPTKGFIAVIFLVLSILLLVTGITGYCVLYIPFGISTKQEKRGEPQWRIESKGS
jgi:hypothetical protein